jgi:hypothetical protein
MLQNGYILIRLFGGDAIAWNNHPVRRQQPVIAAFDLFPCRQSCPQASKF